MQFHSTLNVITTPATMLQSVADVKKQLRIIDEDADSDLLTEYIKCAVEYIEQKTSHVFIETQYLFTMDRWPYMAVAGYAPSPSAPTNGVIEIPRGPLMSVQQIQYIDTNGILTTIDPATYIVDTLSLLGRIWPKRFTYWPITDVMSPNAVQITFKAGYGTAGLIPFRAKQTIKFLVAHWNDNRFPVGDVTNQIPHTLNSMINSLKKKVYRG